MKMIDSVARRHVAAPDEPARPLVPLAERLAHSRPMPDVVVESAEAAAGKDPASDWAFAMFLEKIFFGDEEENGIPELSIDI